MNRKKKTRIKNLTVATMIIFLSIPLLINCQSNDKDMKVNVLSMPLLSHYQLLLSDQDYQSKVNERGISKWKTYDTIPAIFLHEEKSSLDSWRCGFLRNPDKDAGHLIWKCKNEELLFALLLRKEVPELYAEYAFERLFELFGIAKTAEKFQINIDKITNEIDTDRMNNLKSLFKSKVMQLYSISIDFDDIEKNSAYKILNEAKDRIDSGMHILDVYKEIAEKYRYKPEPEKYSRMVVTRITNEGDSYISKNKSHFNFLNKLSQRRGFRDKDINTLLTLKNNQCMILEEKILRSDKKRKSIGKNIHTDYKYAFENIHTDSDNKYVLFQALEIIN